MNLNFQHLLNNYVNTKPANVKEKFFLCANSNLFFRTKANQVIAIFNKIDTTLSNTSVEQHEIPIENYTAQSPHLLKMIDYLEINLKQDLTTIVCKKGNRIFCKSV